MNTNRKQWFIFSAIFFAIGLLSLFSRSINGFSDSFPLYSITAWIFIGLGFACFLSGCEEKSYDPIQQMAYESIIEKNYGKSWAEVVTDRVKGNKIINDYRKEYEKKYGKQWMVKLSEDLNKKRKK